MKENEELEEEEIKVNYYPFYRSFFESLRLESFENVGKIVIAIGEKVFNKKEPQLEGHLMSIYLLIEPNVLKALGNLRNKSKAGKMGGAPKGNKNASKQSQSNTKQSQDNQNQRIERDIENKKDIREGDINNSSEHSSASKKKEPFHKPTLLEVNAFCEEQNFRVNPEAFFDYYESNGWKVGKNPMKDWKAAVRNWEHKEKNPDSSKNSFGQCMSNGYTKSEMDELEKKLLDN